MENFEPIDEKQATRHIETVNQLTVSSSSDVENLQLFIEHN